MAKFQDTKIWVLDPTTQKQVDLKCPTSIDDNGVFSVRVPVELVELVPTAMLPVSVHRNFSRGHLYLRSAVLADVRSVLKKALGALLAPEETVERVIRYYVGSHVSFAECENGDIVPNASWPTSRWRIEDRFGKHHATDPSKGGYSLIVGARVVDKKTLRRGDIVTVSYEYVSGSHTPYAENDPLHLLQAWAAFSLPDTCSEMPYTPEAALFFHRMMLGMAELSRKIQDFMHDERRLLAAIQSGTPLLSAPETH
ncbi:MAG: hypothetical protein EPN77_19440 [Candidimonas sp.]|nr:MAG: hypothetical protein EPN77_19440 [Candidimonas sp.]